jgi:uncharacterized protein (UPF0335 family)
MTNILVNEPGSEKDLKQVLQEFISRLSNIESEMQTLKDDKKELIEEFKSQLDMKTLSQALKVKKVKDEVARKDTFDSYLDILEDDAA